MKKYLVLVFFIIIIGCVKPKGEFAFKRYDQDIYRKIEEPLQFNSNEKISWVYTFSNIKKNSFNVTITLLKKELVWVDVDNRNEKISSERNIIYGSIENLKQGEYKIILYKEKETVDELPFTIFSDDADDYYKYDEE